MNLKLKLLLVAFIALFTLAACTLEPSDTKNGTNNDGKSSTESRDEKALAYSSYLAASFLQDANQMRESDTSHSPMRLLYEEESGFEIDKELGEISAYFNRLKVFLDHGLDNPFTIESDFDINENYDTEMRYTIEGITYTLLFNEDDEGRLDGVLIMNGTEFALEGLREAEREIDNGEEESEEDIYLRTTDIDSDNYVEIEIESEQENDEFEFEMTLTMVVDGFERTLSIDFESDEDEITIDIETANGNTYEFTKEMDDGKTVYHFEYTVNDVDGEVELTITLNADGKRVYHYVIEEDGEEKEFSITDDDTHEAEGEDA